MNSLFTELLNLLDCSEKAELLIKAKLIHSLLPSAKLELKTMSDDTFDELTLAFGEKLHKKLEA